MLIVLPLSHAHQQPVFYEKQPQTFYVGGSGPGNYSTIQSAVDNATSYDIIFVYQDTYYEHVVVDKPLQLIGQHKDQTIIHGSNTGDEACISIQSDFVRIYNFSIYWADWEYHEPGIRNFGKKVLIEHNNISIHDKGIIMMPSSKNCTIINNSFTHNHQAVLLWPMGSNNNLIKNNYFSINNYGIILTNTENNMIINNTLTDHSWEAISIQQTINNIFYQNTIIENAHGIHIDEHCLNNTFYHNNIINNFYQVTDNGQNRWDLGHLIGGNYWSDYNGNDENNDGIGDIPYDIRGIHNYDYYPYMNSNAWLTDQIKITMQLPSFGIINQEIPFDAIVNGGKEPYRFEWDFGDGNKTTEKTTNHTYTKTGNYTITFTVTDVLQKQKQSTITFTIYPQDSIKPSIIINKPQRGLYINDQKIIDFSFEQSIILGPITIDIQAIDNDTCIKNISLQIPGTTTITEQSDHLEYLWVDAGFQYATLIISSTDILDNSAKREYKILRLF